MISGKQISWKYKSKKGEEPVLNGVSFAIRKGRITTFMGQSGAGKTTLLKCIANLCPNYEGVITCKGTDIKGFSSSERASTIGFVLQQFHLFPHLTILKNCTHALIKAIKASEAEAEERASEVLEILGMQAFLHSFPQKLSGGQQQRAAIARALVLQPEILLLDEPTSALDPESKKSLESLLLSLNAKGITIALSSHDMPFIRRIMDYVYFMEKGELVEEWGRECGPLPSQGKINNFLSNT